MDSHNTDKLYTSSAKRSPIGGKNHFNKKHKSLNNYPNGYLEDWSSPIIHSTNNNNSDWGQTVGDDFSNDFIDKPSIYKFKPISFILSTNDNLLLNKDTSYSVRFSTGILEGEGVCINETGDMLTFQDNGSYRFEICGEAVLFSDVDVKLVYFNESFTEDIRSFSEINIPKNEGKLYLRGIPTILPLQRNQSITIKLIPEPDESIILLGGTRLLIHRVA